MNLTRILSLLAAGLAARPRRGRGRSPAAAATSTAITINGQPRVGIFHDEIGSKTADVFRHKGRLTTDVRATRWTERRSTWSGCSPPTPTGCGSPRPGRRHRTPTASTRSSPTSRATRSTAWSTRATPVYAPVTSDVQRLKAMRDFNSQLVEKEQAAILKGKINPDWNNKQVVWQKRTCKTCSVEADRQGQDRRQRLVELPRRLPAGGQEVVLPRGRSTGPPTS